MDEPRSLPDIDADFFDVGRSRADPIALSNRPQGLLIYSPRGEFPNQRSVITGPRACIRTEALRILATCGAA